MSWISFLSHAFVIVFLLSHAHGFNFVVSPPTQCGSQRFTWVGGQPPFTALIFPPDGTLRNVSVPASAWNEKDQSGDFITTLPLVQNNLVVFSMGDATGETSGGMSGVMTVGPPATGAQCNTSDPGVQFFFATDEALAECKDYPFSLFTQSGAVLPISILVTIPLGESFILHPPNNSDPFVWRANLTEGTSVLFTMTDAQNRVGGTSSLVTVQASDDSSCVHPLPSSAAPTRTPSPSGTAPATSTGSSGGGSKSNNSSSHLAIIIGASVGGAVCLAIIAALVYLLAKKERKPTKIKHTRIDLTEPGPDSSAFLLPPGHAQQAHYPPLASFSPYQDSVTPFTGSPNNAPPMATYGNLPPGAARLDGSLTETMGTPMTASFHSVRPANEVFGAQAAAGTKQREGTLAQQRYSQYQQQQFEQQYPQQQQQFEQQYSQQQEYFDPYDPVVSSPTGSNYPAEYNRHTVHSDTLSQFGVASSSNMNIAGPSITSSHQSGSSKQRQSSTSASAPLQPQRFIVHTDIEDEPIELPPMYSESRAPLPGMQSGPARQSQKKRRDGIL